MKKSCFVIWKVREKKSPFSSHTQPKSFDNKAKTWLIISNDSWLSLYKVDKYWSRKYQVPISLGLKKKKKKRREIWALDFSLIRFCQLTIKYSKEKCQYVYIYIYIYISDSGSFCLKNSIALLSNLMQGKKIFFFSKESQSYFDQQPSVRRSRKA